MRLCTSYSLCQKYLPSVFMWLILFCPSLFSSSFIPLNHLLQLLPPPTPASSAYLFPTLILPQLCTSSWLTPSRQQAIWKCLIHLWTPRAWHRCLTYCHRPSLNTWILSPLWSDWQLLLIFQFTIQMSPTYETSILGERLSINWCSHSALYICPSWHIFQSINIYWVPSMYQCFFQALGIYKWTQWIKKIISVIMELISY